MEGSAKWRITPADKATADRHDEPIRTAPGDAFQTVRICKRGGRVRLMVDDVLALAYDDDGKTYGPVHTHSGWIGLRQIAHAERCEYAYVRFILSSRDCCTRHGPSAGP